MTVGTPPGPGPQLIDGVWAQGVASCSNNSFQNGLTALGTTQATALQLAGGIAIYELDTVASGTGVALPFAYAGQDIQIYNNGANTLTVYPSIANNPITAAQDTINNTTSFTVATHVTVGLICGKNGVWGAK